MNAKQTLTAAVILVVAASLAPAITWQTPVCVSTDTQNHSFQVPLNNGWGAQSYDYYHSWFSVPESEYVHVTYWYRSHTGKPDVRYARSINGGMSFPSGERRWISGTDVDSSFTPSLATWGPDNEQHHVQLTWHDDKTNDFVKRYSILRKGNYHQGDGEWGALHNTTYTTWSERCYRPSLATCRRPNEQYKYYTHTVWEDLHENLSKAVIWYERDGYRVGVDTADGDNIRRQVTQADNYWDRNPSVAAELNTSASHNYVYVVWFDSSAGNHQSADVWLSRSTDSGDNWSSPVQLSDTTNRDARAPCVATTGSYVYVVWQQKNASNRYEIRFKRSTNWGASWSSDECISADLMADQDAGTPPECFTPSVACYDNFVYVTCQGGWDSLGYSVGFVMSDDYGVNWACEGLSTGNTPHLPDLETGMTGLFPTISVSKGDAQTGNKFLNILYRAYVNSYYLVYYLRGNNVDELPGQGDGQTAGRTLVSHMNVYPSPARSGTRIALHVVQQGLVDLSIYDAAGRRVRCLGKGMLPVGEYRTAWDGRDESGRRVGAGTYLLVLRTESEALHKRVVLVGE